MTRPERPIVHGGNGNGYDRGCRCVPCTEAHRVRNVRMRSERYARTAANGGIAPVDNHGTFANYRNWGCRCRPCTDANARHSAAARERKRQMAGSPS